MTILRRLLILALCLAPHLRAAAADSPRDHPIAITNVNIVDVTDGSIWRNATIYIRGDRILWVAKNALLEHGEHLTVVNGAERYVIPGLWNMHVHLVQDLPAEYTERVLLPLMVAHGVSGARDMGGNLARLQALRDRIASGSLVGPRIMLAGPMLDGPQPAYSDSLAIATADDARAAVRRLKQEGADFIKVQSLLPRDAYFAVADEAKKQGLMFAGHVPDAVTAAEASEAGQRTMEHMLNILRGCSMDERQIVSTAEEFARLPAVTPAQADAFGQAVRETILRTFNTARADALFSHFVSNRNWQTPTLLLLRFFEQVDRTDWERDARMRFVPAFLRDRWKQKRDGFLKGRTPANLESWKALFRRDRELVRLMRHDYVHILAGTDNAPYSYPGSDMHDELQLMVDNGVTPLDALRSATIEAAVAMRKQRDYGAVAQGRIADIVFLDGNPLEDIGNVRRISAVVMNGHLYERRELDRLIEGAAKAAEAMR